MKHLTKTIAAVAGITLLLSACKKDDEPVVSPPEPERSHNFLHRLEFPKDLMLFRSWFHCI